MASICDLLNEVGCDNIGYQDLGRCITSAKDKKRDKCTEISFCTEETNCNDIMRPIPKKKCLIVWIDIDKYNAALSKVTSKKALI